MVVAGQVQEAGVIQVEEVVSPPDRQLEDVATSRINAPKAVAADQASNPKHI